MNTQKIPRVVIATLGIDQHENGAIAVQRMLTESQMVVSYMGVFNTPLQVAEHAEEIEADVVGISCHSWEYLDLVPQLIGELKTKNLNCGLVIGGSVITQDDAEAMLEKGVDGVFDARSSQDQIVDFVRDLVISKREPEVRT